MTDQGAFVHEIVPLFPRQGQWTASDYFALPDANRIVELSDGELIVAPPPSVDHRRKVKTLSRALDDFVVKHDLGEVFIAPLAVRLEEERYREPDIIIVHKENSRRIKDRYIDGPPDWVAEIISPGTRKADEVDKLVEYAQAGIPEYWLVDPDNQTIRVYVLRGSDSYQLAGAYRPGQIVESETIRGFSIEVNHLTM